MGPIVRVLPELLPLGGATAWAPERRTSPPAAAPAAAPTPTPSRPRKSRRVTGSAMYSSLVWPSWVLRPARRVSPRRYSRLLQPAPLRKSRYLARRPSPLVGRCCLPDTDKRWAHGGADDARGNHDARLRGGRPPPPVHATRWCSRARLRALVSRRGRHREQARLGRQRGGPGGSRRASLGSEDMRGHGRRSAAGRGVRNPGRQSARGKRPWPYPPRHGVSLNRSRHLAHPP